MNTLSFFLTTGLALFYISTFTYYFQTKEYRFDRFFSFVKEKRLFSILVPDKIYKPKPSLRNLLIAGFAIIWTLVLTIITDSPLSWVFAIVFVFLGVAVTEPLALALRGKEINKAKLRLAGSSATVIGITGSYGKTSTKEFLYHILKTEFKTEKTLQNFNTNVGIAISLNKNLKPDTQYFIAEIGAYKKGEIKAVTDWVNPKYGILTGLGSQHIDLFGSKESLIAAKKELLETLPEDGVAYVNADVEGFEKVIDGLKCKIVKFSAVRKDADVYLENSTAHYRNEKFELNTTLNGKHNIFNLVPCVALAYDLGMTKEKIQNVVAELRNEYGKLSSHTGLNNAQILFDGKNSNVEGFISAIEALKKIQVQTKIIITKGIIELGKEKEASYKRIIETLGDTKMITTDNLFKKLDTTNKVQLAKTENEVFAILEKQLNANTALLIEGRFTEPFILKMGVTDK